MADDGSPDVAEAQVTAAQIFDPIAFEKRMEEARARRATALAHRQSKASSTPARPGDRPSTPFVGAQGEECSPPMDRGNAVPSPLVAPRRIRPMQGDESARRIRYVALALLIIGAAVIVAASPGSRQRAAVELSASAAGEPRAGVLPKATQATAGAETRASTGPAANRSATTPTGKLLSEAFETAAFTTSEPATVGMALPLGDVPPPGVDPAGTSVASAGMPVSQTPAALPLAGIPAALAGPATILRAFAADPVLIPAGEAGFGATPLTSATAFVYAPTSLPDSELGKTTAAMREAGFEDVGGAHVEMPISETHVRFFHKEDAAAARLAADILDRDDPAEVRDFTHSARLPAVGRLEVWIASSARQPARAARWPLWASRPDGPARSPVSGCPSGFSTECLVNLTLNAPTARTGKGRHTSVQTRTGTTPGQASGRTPIAEPTVTKSSRGPEHPPASQSKPSTAAETPSVDTSQPRTTDRDRNSFAGKSATGSGKSATSHGKSGSAPGHAANAPAQSGKAGGIGGQNRAGGKDKGSGGKGKGSGGKGKGSDGGKSATSHGKPGSAPGHAANAPGQSGNAGGIGGQNRGGGNGKGGGGHGKGSGGKDKGSDGGNDKGGGSKDKGGGGKGSGGKDKGSGGGNDKGGGSKDKGGGGKGGGGKDKGGGGKGGGGKDRR